VASFSKIELFSLHCFFEFQIGPMERAMDILEHAVVYSGFVESMMRLYTFY
jgi:hypothetical protein